jgi:hypothetical protein
MAGNTIGKYDPFVIKFPNGRVACYMGTNYLTGTVSKIIAAWSSPSETGLNKTISSIDKVTIFPNPAFDFVKINIDNANKEDIEFYLYSVNGLLVRSEILKQNNRQIFIGDLSDGIYVAFIKSTDLNDNIKLIIQK